MPQVLNLYSLLFSCGHEQCVSNFFNKRARTQWGTTRIKHHFHVMTILRQEFVLGGQLKHSLILQIGWLALVNR